jgi:hypothetical protein
LDSFFGLFFGTMPHFRTKVVAKRKEDKREIGLGGRSKQKARGGKERIKSKERRPVKYVNHCRVAFA